MAFGENPQGFTEGRIPFYRKKEKRGYRNKKGSYEERKLER